MAIFDRRVAFKPFEYPDLTVFKDAINHSYWLVSEWNFTSDVQDFHTRLDSRERNAVKNTLLAISQIEVAVKKFWTRLGDRFPKPEFEQVGVTCGESECYDEQTEILTNKGWKLFKDLAKADKVAQFNISDNSINFTLPKNHIIKHYQGLMHHYYSKGTDIMITPSHELLVSHPVYHGYIKRKSCDGLWGRNYTYPTSGKATCNNAVIFTDIDRLLIAIQADGCLYGCTPSGKGRRDFMFNLNKSRKILRLIDILDKLHIEYTKSIRPNNGMTVINARLPDDINIDVSDIKGFDYINLECVNDDYAVQFINELSYWDAGSHGNKGNFTYYNTNEAAINKVQAIATLGQISSNKAINRTDIQSLDKLLPDGSRKLTAKTCYALNITYHHEKTYPYRIEIPYDGTVYCVEVESGAIVTRRNKRVAVCGNCRHADAYSHLLTVLNLNSDFEKLLEVPAIQGRVGYLNKYLANAQAKANQDYTLTLTLFSLFIENVSLFSQFVVMKSFNKYMNILKDIDNVVQATMKEEQLHALLGVHIINQIKLEYPQWFTDSFYQQIQDASHKAYQAECGIINWIFEQGELPFLSKYTLKEFIKQRFNESCKLINCPQPFDVNKQELVKLQWFEDEIYGQVNADFFHKRPVTYSKKMHAITAEDLF